MARDSFDSNDPPVRVGGTALNRYSSINGSATTATNEMCLHQGEIWAIHSDTEPPGPGVIYRGPFVERFDGNVWNHVGGEIEENLSIIIPFPEPGVGRLAPSHCQIASDGTDVYIAYTVSQYVNPPGGDNDYTTVNVILRKWDGAAWVLLQEFVGIHIQNDLDGTFQGEEVFLDASPLDPGRCHAAWPDLHHIYYANSDMSTPIVLIEDSPGPFIGPTTRIITQGSGDLRVGSNGIPYFFCTCDAYVANPSNPDDSSHFFGGRMIDCLSGETVQFYNNSIFFGGVGGTGTAWGFVRQGDAFAGNHPDYDSLWALGIGGVLWRDTDPNAAAGIISTRAAGFRAGVWTVAGNGQTATSFANQASALVGTFNPDLLVLDCEFVAKGYAPDDPSFDPTYGTGWRWNEDMISELRTLQPFQPLAVTMLPVQSNHADFNFEAYTSRRCSIWPQAYDGNVNPIDPVGMFQSTVANGVDPDLIVVVLGAPDYATEVDAMVEAGYLTWAVFTLDDLPGTPTSTLPPPTNSIDDPEKSFNGSLASTSPIITREGRDLFYCMLETSMDGHAKVVQVPADGSGPFEPLDGEVRFSTPFEEPGDPGSSEQTIGTGYGSFAHDSVSDNLYFVETFLDAFPVRTHVFQRQCPLHSWVPFSNISVNNTSAEGLNTFPPFADGDVGLSNANNSALCAGRPHIFIVGDKVYVMVLYTAGGLFSYAGVDTNNPNDYRCSQIIVYEQNICRLCQACSSPVGQTGAPYLDIEFRGEDSNADPAAPNDVRPKANFSGIRFRAER